MRLTKVLLVLTVTVAGAACGAAPRQAGDTLGGSPTAPSLVQGHGVEIAVSRLRVFLKDARPQAYVEAPLGDGCTNLDPVTQRRDGHSIAVTMNASRQHGIPCTMISKHVNEWVPLSGGFGAGSYSLRVNRASAGFRLIVDASGGRRIEPDPGPLPEDPPPTPGAVSPNDPPGGSQDPGQIPAAPGGQR